MASVILIFGCAKEEARSPERAQISQTADKLPAAALQQEIKAQISKEMSLLVADFDSGQKPNNLGGDFGTWDKDSSDPTMYIRMSFNTANAKDETGFCLRLDYDIDSPNPAYNGFWMKLENVDLRPYRKLAFELKGDRASGYTSRFKLEMKNKKGEIGKYIVTDVSGAWQAISIDLEKFKDITDWSDMAELVIVFDDINSTQKVGTIYIDNVKFTN